MGPPGLESAPLAISKTPISQRGDAECDARCARANFDDGLNTCIEAWPLLPTYIKAAIGALVEAAAGKGVWDV